MGHLAAARKGNVTPNNTETIERMTCVIVFCDQSEETLRALPTQLKKLIMQVMFITVSCIEGTGSNR